MTPINLKHKLKEIELQVTELYDAVAGDWYGLDYVDAIIKISNPIVDIIEKVTDLIQKGEIS